MSGFSSEELVTASLEDLFPSNLEALGEYRYVMAVGSPPNIEIYLILENQLLLRFDQKSSRDQVDSHMRRLENNLPIKERDWSATGEQNYGPTLRRRNLRWVEANTSEITLSQLTRQIVMADDDSTSIVERVTPIYVPAYGELATAASLVWENLIVVPEEGTATSELQDRIEDSFRSSLAIEFQSSSTLHYRILAPEEVGDDFDPLANAYDLVDFLNLTDGVAYAEFDWLKVFSSSMPASPGPDDPGWQPGKDQWNLTRIKAPVTWSKFTIENSVAIAIIDDGFELSHEALNFCDVKYHFNALQPSPTQPMDAGPYQFLDSESLHGTNVAGIAAAGGLGESVWNCAWMHNHPSEDRSRSSC